MRDLTPIERKLIEDLVSVFIKLAVINPCINQHLGISLPTMDNFVDCSNAVH